MDLWEGKNVYGEQINTSNKPYTVQMKQALQKLRLVNSDFAARVEKNLILF